MDIFKDRILLICLTIAALTGGMLIFNNLSILSYKSSEERSAPVVDKTIADMADKIEKNTLAQTYTPTEIVPQPTTASTEEAVVAAAEESQKKQIEDDLQEATLSAPAAAVQPLVKTPKTTTATANIYGNKIQIQRSRPKLGGNEWLVGPGAGADSTELSSILQNLNDGDIISVSKGTYEIDLGEIPARSFEIHGEDGVVIAFKKSYHKLKSPNLLVKDVKLEFPKGEDYFNFTSDLSHLTFDNVIVSKTNLRLSFSGNLKLHAKNSSFLSTSINFWNHSQGTIENCFFEKTDSFVSVSDFSTVELKNTKMMNFTTTAIWVGSYQATLTAENLRVSNGNSAIGGKANESNAKIRDSEFRNLDYFTSRDVTVSCAACQKTNIKY